MLFMVLGNEISFASGKNPFVPQAILEITQKLTKFATLDFEVKALERLLLWL